MKERTERKREDIGEGRKRGGAMTRDGKSRRVAEV